MPQLVAIGANAGLPATWHDILEKAQVLRNHARQHPVPFLRHPLRTAGQKQGSCGLVRGTDLDGDQGTCAGGYGRALDEELDAGVTHRPVVAEAVTHADELVSVALGEAFGTVLIWRVRLGNA